VMIHIPPVDVEVALSRSQIAEYCNKVGDHTFSVLFRRRHFENATVRRSLFILLYNEVEGPDDVPPPMIVEVVLSSAENVERIHMSLSPVWNIVVSSIMPLHNCTITIIIHYLHAPLSCLNGRRVTIFPNA